MRHFKNPFEIRTELLINHTGFSDNKLMKALNDLLNYLIAISVIALAASFFYFNDSKKKFYPINHALNSSEKDKLVDQVVNKHIKEANQLNTANQLKMDRALFEARKKVLAADELARQKEDLKNQKIPLERQVVTEAELRRQAEQLPPVEAPVVKSRKSNRSVELDVSKMTPEEKDEYARQYIENARKGGYHIELSEDLEVIKATPIRKPSQQLDTVETGQTE